MSDSKGQLDPVKLLTGIVSDMHRTIAITYLLLREGRHDEALEWVVAPLVESGTVPQFLPAKERAALAEWAKKCGTEVNVEPLPEDDPEYEDRALEGLRNMGRIVEAR